MLGGLEQFTYPISTWLFVQRVVVSTSTEKHNKLLEYMKIAGLQESTYWGSYFLTEGVVIGFIAATITMFMSIGPVFKWVNPALIWVFTYIFYLAAVPFGFFMVAIFEKPATASQATLATMSGCYVLFLALKLDYASHYLQRVMCFIPPVALQLGASSTKKSYEGIGLGEIIGYLIIDIFLYSIVAWYIVQIRPSEHGVARSPTFIFSKDYWMGENAFVAGASPVEQINPLEVSLSATGNDLPSASIEMNDIPRESDDAAWGKPTVTLSGLQKTFGSTKVVDGLSFNMYETQIFALLGHNGAGKTTTINMLTGLTPTDWGLRGETSIYGHGISNDMDGCRTVMGLCPQHDVLFPLLDVSEHILFFSQLKGTPLDVAKEEVMHYAEKFKLTERLDHLGKELSGGQRRKLSVSIAVCGGSKFVVLDEPTAGMDPVARRDLWDLLKSLRQGRTMLLTTHYMDEADTLGNRIAIMSLGQIQCLGSAQFLKSSFGAGYRLTMSLKTVPGEGGKLVRDPKVKVKEIMAFLKQTFPKCTPELGGINEVEDRPIKKSLSHRERSRLSRSVSRDVERDIAVASKKAVDDSRGASDTQLVCSIGFEEVAKFGKYFKTLESKAASQGVESFGVTITSLEDVFLEVGGDHNVVPDFETFQVGIGATKYEFSIMRQIFGIIQRKLFVAINDLTVYCMVLFPIISLIVSSSVYKDQVISSDDLTNNIVWIMIASFSMLMVPGLIAEFIVRERENKLRTVLTVMGCDIFAYWGGTFIVDFLLLSLIPISAMISWSAAGMEDFLSNSLCYFILFVFLIHLTSFGYLMTFVFRSSASSIFVTPTIILGLLIAPNILLSLTVIIFDIGLHAFTVSNNVALGTIGYGLAICSPQGNFIAAMLDASYDISSYTDKFPPAWFSILMALVESAIFISIAITADYRSVVSLMKKDLGDDESDEKGMELAASMTKKELEDGKSENVYRLGLEDSDDVDEDIVQEVKRVRAMESDDAPLIVNGLRKVFLPKQVGRKPVTAARGVHFAVAKNEIFGLLGANGAGKSTTMNMLTRHFLPTAGDAFVSGYSVLSDFSNATRRFGVVTQDNSIWDLLSVENHLKLFARLRGVTEDELKVVTDAVINQLELIPHRHKLAGRLSGGMKRKLCVAIALIGNPDVCLLDEPSAGLDPVSRRNLWEVILRTMSTRSVVLTTHSMEEAEALCDRIGIMVQGQLRALGTKQTLKTKYGGHYELVVKLLSSAGISDEVALNEVVLRLFPMAERENDSGMITFRVPSNQMSLGRAFEMLEQKRNALKIETYSISQPTLERVFIDTVRRHDETTSTKEVGSPRLSRSSVSGGVDRAQLDYLNDPNAGLGRDESQEEDVAEIFLPVNSCGCTIPTTRRVVAAMLFFYIIFAALQVTTRESVFLALSTITFFSMIISCCVWQCPCCQPVEDKDP